MSFINNSLKNAQQTQSRDAAPAGCPPYLQMDFHTSKRSNLPLAILMVVMMVFTGFMIRAWYRSGHMEMKARARTADTARPMAAPQTASRTKPVPIAVEETKPAEVPADAAAAAQPGSGAPASVTAIPAETPKGEAEVYKLQGVVFDPGHSTAVINGKTVAEGERVGSARVLSIAKDSAVILNAKGQTVVLDLQ